MSVNAPNEKLGWKAPNFNLKNIDNNYYTLESLKGKKGTVIAFICNHCPYVIAMAKRLCFEAKELKKSEINTIAIMSNDAIQYPDDCFEKMILFSKSYEFDFPYLHDETQKIAKKYGAVCTPDIFGFNSELNLQYRGRIDSNVMNTIAKKNRRELFEAMNKIKSDGIGPEEQFNSFGCSIKWKEDE